MNEFKVGDVVMLKSGGPRMTITHLGPYESMLNDKQVRCEWFDPKRLKPFSQNFFIDTIDKVSPSPFIG